MTEWFEDESFWQLLHPFLFPDERIEAAKTEIGQILELVDFEGRTVLDLCCGPGRHSVELAQRGYQVTGVDRSSYLLGKARERGKQLAVDVEWIEADMREFARPNAFDLILNLYTSFGYFQNADDDLTVLQIARSNLRPEGILVMQLAGKEQIAAVFQPSAADEIADAGLLVQQREVRDGWSRLHNRWTVVVDGRATTVEFEHTLYSARELRSLLEAAGFDTIRCFGSLDGREYGPDAERLIVAASGDARQR